MNERQRAIEDVARATNWSTDDVKLFILHAGTASEDGSDKALVYAVTQRERVLILEAENAELKAKLEGQWNARS